ncbi:MAG TPA: hypothetical protein VGD03_13790 [Frankiaceae bacterium]
MLAFILVTPLLLLLGLLAMERVERPFARDAIADDLEVFLTTAHPEDVETYVSEGYAQALDRYWRRRRRGTKKVPAGS